MAKIRKLTSLLVIISVLYSTTFSQSLSVEETVKYIKNKLDVYSYHDVKLDDFDKTIGIIRLIMYPKETESIDKMDYYIPIKDVVISYEYDRSF